LNVTALNWLPETPARIAVGMSGGVDSNAVAHLLKQAGHDVVGLTAWTLNGPGSCCNDALVNAARICEQLGCDFDTVDLRAEFSHYVMNHYNRSYAAGITPNPCVECNRYVKWEKLIDYAVNTLGCEYIATGHYCRLARPQGPQGPALLCRAEDERKDQTYMLARVYYPDIRRALFPLGDWVKTDVMAYAQEHGLIGVGYKESVDVCFVPEGQAAYLKGTLGIRKGPVVDIDKEKVIGEHEGHWLFTQGQRKGINIASDRPLYVIRTDAKSNTVYVGNKEHLNSTQLQILEMNWLSEAPPKQSFEALVKIRYAAQPSRAWLTPSKTQLGAWQVTLHEPQSAVTPGQVAAIYDLNFEQLLGGGYIETCEAQQPFSPENYTYVTQEPKTCQL
jgi:tRNA-uridine 2-sulfurtransferase